ncbi:MAG: ABC transporter ATP-binding protein [Tissierellia bacterium]|nr:ABC transporter ATP-binding protein [Tissierellia bacterium]
MTKAIVVKNLSIAYEEKKGYKEIIENIDFYIEPGEMLAIIGESGSGKSTITKAMAGLLPRSAKITGTMTIDDVKYDLSNAFERKKISGKKIGLIFQDAMSSLNPMRKIKKNFEEIFVEIQNLSKIESYEKATEILKILGFSDCDRILDSYPFELSGGMCQRIVIAMVIAMSPKILIADEITSALDIVSIKESMQLIKDISKKFGISVLFITHDMDAAKTYSDRIMLLKNSKLIKIEKSDIPAFYSEENNLSISNNKAELLKVINLNKSYDNFKVLKDLNFSLYKEESLGILGKSGCGKSTLAKILACIETYEDGHIVFDSEELKEMHRLKKQNIYRDIQLVFQDERGCLNPRMKIKDIVMEPIRNLNLDYENKNLEVEKYLKLVSLDSSHYDKKAVQLSTGQCQRVSLARALIVKPKLLILDEMVSALDSELKWKIVKLLNEIKKTEKLSFIVISHEIDVIAALCDRVLFMKDGKININIDTHQMSVTNLKELYYREEINENC